MTTTHIDPTKTLASVLRAGMPDYQVEFKNEQTKYGIDVPKLAADIEVTKKTVFQWLLDNSLPGRRAKQLMGLPNSKLTILALEPFITSA